MIYVLNIRKTFPIKFSGIFPSNVPGMLNIGIFAECSMNICYMNFLGGSRNTMVVSSSG